MSDWDDLFSAAVGASTGTDPLPNHSEPAKKRQVRKDEGRAHSKKKKKARLGSQKKSQRALESRTDPVNEQIWSQLPPWLSLGASLRSLKFCEKWIHDGNSSLDAKCKNCGRSALHHALHVSSSSGFGQTEHALEAFTLIRDVRCCCSSILDEAYNRPTKANAVAKCYAKTAMKKAAQLARSKLCSMLNSGEAEILSRKFTTIATSAEVLKEKTKKWSNELQRKDKTFLLSGIFDALVQLIIDCDGAYFRLYYLQNIDNLTICNAESSIPHPPTYFGSNNLSCNAKGMVVSDFVNWVKNTLNGISESQWKEILRDIGMVCDTEISNMDSLSYMHQNRFAESIYIFWKSGWMSSERTLIETNRSIQPETKTSKNHNHDPEEMFYDIHQTPAPMIIQKWRDSCRDLLCNLYAYATVTPESIENIKKNLLTKGISKVLEMGAGTGYIAYLFNDVGMSVSAFDIAPTMSLDGQQTTQGAINEYHGFSPSYYEVHCAQSTDTSSLLKDKKEAKETALLLCYPPPMSSMAEDTLKSFVKSGGRIVIHIGEFSGLTGSQAFESLLRRKFRLQHRTQCLHWGTDAAEVTIWKKIRKEDQNPPSLFKPCSNCEKKEAMKRFRLLRTLNYCSSQCFDEHFNTIRAHLSFSMIPLNMANEAISFGNENYFLHFK